MGEMEMVLQVQVWSAGQNDRQKIATERVQEVDLDDELSSLLILSHYLDTEGNVFQQFQYMAWSEDETRLSSYYEDSVIDALAELAVFCYLGLNADTDTIEDSSDIGS